MRAIGKEVSWITVFFSEDDLFRIYAHLHHSVEHLWLRLVAFWPIICVQHIDIDQGWVGGGRCDINIDFAIFAVLDRIGDQVDQYIFQARMIVVDRSHLKRLVNIKYQIGAFEFDLLNEQPLDFLQCFRDVELWALQWNLFAFQEPWEVHNLVDLAVQYQNTVIDIVQGLAVLDGKIRPQVVSVHFYAV